MPAERGAVIRLVDASTRSGWWWGKNLPIIIENNLQPDRPARVRSGNNNKQKIWDGLGKWLGGFCEGSVLGWFCDCSRRVLGCLWEGLGLVSELF